MKELNKTIQDLEREVEIAKKSHSGTSLIENLGKHSGVIDASINNRIRDRRISDAEDTIEHIDSTVNKNGKWNMQKICNPKHPGNSGHNENNKAKDYSYRRK